MKRVSPWRLVLLLPAALFFSSCAMFHYDSSLVPSLPPGSAAPTPQPTYAGSHRVVWFLGLFPLDELVPPTQGASHVHLAQDWFEVLITLATLGGIQPMEVRTDAAPGAVSPFGVDVLDTGDMARGGHPDITNASREGWLLFGLIPIDGGVQVANCPSCEIKDFKVTRELKVDDLGNILKVVLTLGTLGLVTPVDLHWYADAPLPSEGHMPAPPKPKKTKRSEP